MSRTAFVMIIGLILVTLFLTIGSRVEKIGLRRASEGFILVWLVLSIGNMAIGVVDAGYGLLEEVLYALIIFLPPAAIAITVLIISRTARSRNAS